MDRKSINKIELTSDPKQGSETMKFFMCSVIERKFVCVCKIKATTTTKTTDGHCNRAVNFV